jgi:hypothetical protein
MTPDAAPAKPDPRFRVTRIVAGHEGDLAAELEAADDAGYRTSDALVVLGNGDLLVISHKPRKAGKA